MFCEEKVVSGILCWRSNPDGAWHEYNTQELSMKVMGLQHQIEQAGRELPQDDIDILKQANDLAREFYDVAGVVVPEGYRFDLATKPAEVDSWSLACLAMTILKGVDVDASLRRLNGR
jgi:hypothetical protein